MTLKEIGEDAIIKLIKSTFDSDIFAYDDQSVIMGIGDDCSVHTPSFDTLTLTTTDTMTEGVHFIKELTNPELIGRKSINISLSDIAAMGALPRYLLLSLNLPETTKKNELQAILKGIKDSATKFNLKLIGGNTSLSPKDLSITTTVLGEAREDSVIYRHGAGAGELVFTSGTLGDSALGLKILKESGAEAMKGPYRPLCMRHLSPTPRVTAGGMLSGLGLATSMTDISDGVVKDLTNIIDACNARTDKTKTSKLGAKLFLEQVPLSNEFTMYMEEGPGKDLSELERAQLISGGEDYELLFTVKAEDEKKVVSAGMQAKLNFTKIGMITDTPEIVVTGPDGGDIEPGSCGFEHFK